jgi:AmmeMemoRadiSam system protein A
MNSKISRKVSCKSVFVHCLSSFILFSLLSLGLHTASAKEEGQPLSGTMPANTLTDERMGKEGDMVETDELTEEEGRYLLALARQTIEESLFGEKNQEQPDVDLSPKLSEERGTFVTLTKNGVLRGCIGHILPQESVIEGIRVNAINAAYRDPRFPPLSKEEWKNVKVEVSILTEPRPLEYADADDLLNKLRPGIDGLIIKKGFRQATFLPQVWEQLPDKKEFLRHLCLKAGLDREAWKHEKLEVSVYQAQAFEEH